MPTTDVGHLGEAPAHRADAAPHFEHAPPDVRREEAEEMRAIPLRLAHRFQVVCRVLFGGLRLSPIGVVHAPSRFACTVPYGDDRGQCARTVERVIEVCALASAGQRARLLRRWRRCSGRHVLAHPASTIVHDVGDPLLTAALLHWNAWTLPLTHAWWQLPIFAPTPDVLAFSEHLLGLSVVATPVEWLVRDPLAAANLVTLLTYPLCGVAMFLLVRRLTGSPAAAFLAGLALRSRPYRAAQMPHLQMLATFWAPLALLGLHGYLDSGRRGLARALRRGVAAAGAREPL